MGKPRNIYCISGLGADHRIFNKLKIKDATLIPVKWEMPNVGDGMQSFALKLSKQITDENPIIIGVSYGGMLATELSELLHAQKVFIISSCTHKTMINKWLRLAGALRLHKLLPYHLLLKSNVLNRLIFDPRSKEEELYLKKLMLKDNDIQFLRRSVQIIMQWDRKKPTENLVHIHGSKDVLLPVDKSKVNYYIQDGGHFMVWNKAKEIATIIEQELETLG